MNVCIKCAWFIQGCHRTCDSWAKEQLERDKADKVAMKINYITADQMNDHIASPASDVPIGLYVAVNGPYWVGMDNREGQAVVHDVADEGAIEEWFRERAVG